MTNRTIGQTPPDRANELFAQLLDTPDLAAESREQLFSALRQELGLLASLQEQHLFPVLEKHPETADLVRDARNDTQQTRTLLDELETMPKDSDTFIAKVADLRRVFQQHIRNDKNELLPVVLKVLSEEEVEAVVEKVEEEIAEVEQTKRATARRRVAARGKPRLTEEAQSTEGSLLATIEAQAEGVEEVTQTVQEAAQDSVHTASETAGRSIDVLGRQNRETLNLIDRAAQYPQAIARSHRILAHGAGTIALEWFGLRQERLLKNIGAMNELLTCRSVQDVVNVQRSVVREYLKSMIETNQRLVQLTTQVAQEASRTITASPRV
ncbi:phasin family protein [Microvirga aerilata]|uniref:Phasin family protein n=2 Tax=Microvirga aerilata TaxID=670292 RepID=A0A936ZII8_9HYPH|nr:hemerythrin domain-containing protein [Microvirga aerilata]MBL0408340.1 phasin family protein [Microvirga aerilata]